MGTIASLLVKLGIDTSAYHQGLAGAAEDAKQASSGGGLLGSLAGGLATIGLAAGGITAIAGGVSTVGNTIAGVVSPFNEWADTVDSIGDSLGTTAEEGSGLAVMAKGVGADVSSLTGQLVFMARGLEDGKGGLGATGKAVEGLGVSLFDANGKMRSSTQIFGDVATRLAAMPDGLQKSALMMDIFGKSGAGMSDIVNAAANGGIQNAIDKSKALGLAMGEDGVNSSIEFGKGMADVQMIGQGLMVTLGSELMPVLVPLIKEFAAWAIDVMPIVIQAIKDLVKFGKEDAIPFVANLWAKFQEFLDFLEKFFKPVFDNMREVFKLFSLAFQGDWKGFGEQLRTIWDTAIGQVKKIFSDAWEGLKNTDWGAVAHSIGEGLVNGVIGITDWVVGAVMGLGGAILAAIKGFLGIASESKVFRMQVGMEIGRGLASGAEESISTAMGRVRNAMRGGFTGSLGLPSLAGVSAGGTQPVIVQLDYRPTFSFADEREARERLAPFISAGVKTELARTK